MLDRRRTLIVLSVMVSTVLALALWRIGVKGTTELVAFIGAVITAIGGLLGLLVPESTSAGTAAAPPAGAPDDAGTSPAEDAAQRPARRRQYRRWAEGIVAVIPALLVVALLVQQVGGDGTGTGQAAPTTASPAPGPTDGTPTTEPTSPSSAPSGTGSKPGPAGQPWDPPAGTPEWTLNDTDAIQFVPKPVKLTRTGSGDLIFQGNMHQISWYQWTDSDDLSYQGCRDQSVPHWDSLKLDLVTVPATYCRQALSDPNKVEYVQILALDMEANPPYVKVKVWVYHP